jgi:hypothetical protein
MLRCAQIRYFEASSKKGEIILAAAAAAAKGLFMVKT